MGRVQGGLDANRGGFGAAILRLAGGNEVAAEDYEAGYKKGDANAMRIRAEFPIPPEGGLELGKLASCMLLPAGEVRLHS
jgi:hypothetical protein